jgi:PAS domain S-box-containing protein
MNPMRPSIPSPDLFPPKQQADATRELLALRRALEREKSARLQAEARARDAVEVLEGIGDGFFAFDREWRFAYVNREAERIFGRDREQLFGRVVWDVLPRSRDSVFYRRYRRAMRDGVPVSFEAPSAELPGVWFEARAYPSASGLSVHFHDITARKQIEARLRLHADLLDSVGEAVIGCDADGVVIYWSVAAERLFGRSAQEAMGRSVFDIAPPAAFRERALEIHRELSLDGRPWSGEFRAEHRDGSTLPIVLNLTPLADDEGGVSGVVAVCTDISRQKREEEAQRFLAEAGALLASSLDIDETLKRIVRLAVPVLGDWCFLDLVEEDGTLRRVEIAHVDPRKEELARGLFAYPPEADGPNISSRVLRTGETWCSEEVPEERLADLSHHPEHLRILRSLGIRSGIAVPLIARGRTVGVLRVAATEGDRRLSEADVPLVEQLARRAAVAIDNAHLYAQSRQAVAAREQILRVVSHDLRNPLHAITAHADLLAETLEDSAAAARQWIGTIRRASDQMERLLRDLRDAAYLERGKLSISRERCRVTEILAEASAQLRSLATESGLRWNVSPPERDAEVEVDRARILQVVSNLVGNACRFTTAGGEVSFVASVDDERVTFSVADTGPGIEPDELPYVFEPFWRGRASAAGTGLGLAIAAGIVESHGASLEVRRTGAKGTVFAFSLSRAASREGSG